MKQKLVARIQSLGRQASQLRQVVEAAPAQAARLRESVVLTVGQLQQLRSEIQTGIAELRADTGDHLLKVLGEIRDSTEVLGEAGFELAGVDLELGLGASQRLLLRLRKVAEVSAAKIGALAAAHAGRPGLRGVLGGLQRAVELAGTIDLPDHDFREITVVVGPVPTLRIGWRDEAELPPPPPPGLVAEAPPVLTTATSVSGPPTVTLAPEPAVVSVLAPVPAPARPVPPSRVQPEPVSAPPAPTPPPSTAAKVLGEHWRSNALDRFKKMPDLGKRS